MKEALWDFCVDSILPFLRLRFWGQLLLFVIAGAALASVCYFLIQYLNSSFQLLPPSEPKPTGPQLASAWTIVAALSAGAFALWRWTVDQRWRRVQYAQQLFKEFFAKESTQLALRMLDVKGEFELPAPNSARGKHNIEVTEDLLTHSLLTFDHQEMFEEPYFRVRMIFDEFFTDLSMFQHHIDAGLLEVRDIRPYLAYWVKAMRGHGSIHTIRVAGQIDAFLRAFDYQAVLRLFRSIGPSLRTVECCVAPEILKADQSLFHEIEKEALNWEAQERPSAAVPNHVAKLVHGAADRRFPIYLREYRLGTAIGKKYITVIQSDFTDCGSGKAPRREERGILWDRCEKQCIPTRKLFENSDEAVKSLPGEIIARGPANSTPIDLLASLVPVKRSRSPSRGFDFHYPPAGIGESLVDRGTIFWPLGDFEKHLSDKGKSVFTALANDP